ncbi:MAG TPA: cytochrome c peroxidase, partial [Myxococcota bacterium]
MYRSIRAAKRTGAIRTLPWLAAACLSLAWTNSPARSEALTPGGYQEFMVGYRRGAGAPVPATNRSTPERERLGKTLFFDPRLSASGVMSCGTCHNPGLSWGDGLPKGVGHGMKTLGRRTPTLLNVAWSELFFWDGRAASLEEQALGPIASPDEMNLPLEALVPKLRAIPEYAPRFEEAYPGEGISTDTISKAIASFERTVVSGRAPFDAWLEGDEDAISEAAKRGFVLFNEKARCSTCHGGWRFTDDSFHDIGVGGEDRGRGAVLADIEVLQFAFKTPTLRNVDRR